MATSDSVKNTLLKIIRVLDKGIMMESNAHDFYERASIVSKDPNAKKVFNWLAQWELGHKARLEAKRKDLLAHASIKGEAPPAMEEYKVSETGPWLKIPDNMSELDILKLAYKNERKAYSFFQKKITFSEDESLKAFFTQMAKEEDKHCKIIDDQIRHIKMNKIWKDFEEYEKEN